MAGPEVSLRDARGHAPRVGESGEIVVRGPTVFAGYEGDPIANETAFADGWFRTGDQGYFDADGYLHITGRIEDTINRGGESISRRRSTRSSWTIPPWPKPLPSRCRMRG